MDRRDFIKIGSSCIIAPVFLNGCIEKKGGGINEKTNDAEAYLEHVELHLAQHCNLNCKYCSHFSTIAEKEFYNISKYKKDLKKISQLTNKKIKNIQLLGGEPLLHPEINEIIKITREFFPYTQIQIITNGILLETINDSFYKTLNENKTAIIASIYPINLNWDIILKRAQKYNVDIFPDAIHGKLTLKNINQLTIKSFYKLKLDLSGKQTIDKKCRFHGNCAYFDDGKLYPCFVVGNIRHFNKRFNKKIPVTNKDFIDIYKIKNIKEISTFFQKLVPFCKYCCNAKASNENWSCNSKGDISEWT